MLKSVAISRDSSGNTTLTHNIAVGTYSSVPSLSTDGFWIKSQGANIYDAYEILFTVSGGDDTTTVSFRPWFYVPDHLTGGAAGWLAGDLLDSLPVSSATTSTLSAVERINTVPVSAIRMYIQVVGTGGTAPTDVYFTIYGLQGDVADVSGTSGGGGGGGSSSATASASAGGGDAVYISPVDFLANYTSSSTLTLTGLPFTPDTEQFISVSVFNSTGEETIYVPSNNAFSYDSATGILTVTGALFDGTNIGYRVLLWGPTKAYSAALDARSALRLNPAWEQYSGATVADVTNGTDGTYDYYLDMSAYNHASFQLELSGGSGTVTVTLHGTVQDDGTAASSCTYQDIGTDTFSAASWTSNTILVDDAGKLAGFKYLKLEVVAATGGANDADWQIFSKQWY